MQEEWKDIKGYEGLYQVSNLGRVKQCHVYTNLNGKGYTRKEKIKKQTVVGNYYKVGLTKDGKNKLFLVHRLVAQAFIPNDDSTKDCINHKDENGFNNVVTNLEWCDRTYNDNYGTRNYRLGLISAEYANLHRQELSERTKKSWESGRNKGFTGKKHSEETKKRISQIIKNQYINGRVNPMKDVHRYGKDAPRYGAKLSDETKNKISNSVKGFKHTDSAKKKMSDNMKHRIFVNDGVKNKRIRPDELQTYLSLGYVQGRLTPWQ